MQGTEFALLCPNLKEEFLMSFVRTVKRENPFVQLDKEYIGNGTLSLKATGLLTYILSRPDGWKIRMKDIQKRFNDGETSVRSAMNELLKNGYVHRYQERAEKGKFSEWIYDVYERPEYNPHYKPERENHVSAPKRDFPHSDNPNTDKPNSGNHEYINNDFSNNDLNNNDLNNIDKDIVNKEDVNNIFKNICNEFYNEFSPGRWNKDNWIKIVDKYINEIIEKEVYKKVPSENWVSYVYSSIKNIAYKHDLKNGKLDLKNSSEGLFYDWLNAK